MFNANIVDAIFKTNTIEKARGVQINVGSWDTVKRVPIEWIARLLQERALGNCSKIPLIFHIREAVHAITDARGDPPGGKVSLEFLQAVCMCAATFQATYTIDDLVPSCEEGRHEDLPATFATAAACLGDLRLVEQSEKDAGVNKNSKYLGSPLCAAARNGHSDIVKHLLNHGAEPELAAGFYSTPFDAACEGGHLHILELLPCPDYKDHNACWCSGFRGAAAEDRVEVLQFLTNKTQQGLISTWILNDALITACWRGSIGAAKFLLESGASPENKNRDYKDRTALQLAAAGGNVDLIRLLLAYGADPKYGETRAPDAVTVAASRGHAHVMEILLDAGGVVNEFPNALVAAAKHGQVETARLLLEWAIPIRKVWAEQAVMYACVEGHGSMVRLLARKTFLSIMNTVPQGILLMHQSCKPRATVITTLCRFYMNSVCRCLMGSPSEISKRVSLTSN